MGGIRGWQEKATADFRGVATVPKVYPERDARTQP